MAMNRIQFQKGLSLAEFMRSFGSEKQCLAVRVLCDRVAVMHEGRIVEQGPTDAVFAHPATGITRRLIAAVPLPEVEDGWLDASPPGTPAIRGSGSFFSHLSRKHVSFITDPSPAARFMTESSGAGPVRGRGIMGRLPGKKTLGAALAAIAVAGAPFAARAQAAPQDQNITVSIPGQRLSDALRQFAVAASLQLVYDTKITDGKTSPAVSGAMTPRVALGQLLAGSGLNYRFSSDRTVVISAAAAASDGVRAIGVVSVEGVAGTMPYGESTSPVNGTNGSRDVEATEGTHSYTTGAVSIVSKIPQTLRETPQTVSVLTAQRIQDQSLVSLKDMLVALPGTTFTPGPNSEEFNIYSRGFQVQTFSIDGGAPVTYNFGNRPVINMSEFDSVQLVRGANGLFGGYGDPGGTVNLLRKKPLDHRQIAYTQEVGSWHRFREEIDATQPLTSDGSLRGRVVASRLDNRFSYDVAEAHKSSLYGVLDYDLASKTLLTVGGSWSRENNNPNQGGLPRYLDGGEIDFPTSTCLCLNSGFDRAERTEVFATLSHQIDDNWTGKVNLTYDRQSVDALYYGISSSVVRGGAAKSTFGGYHGINPAKDYALDYTLTGKINLFDRQHLLVVGGNYRYLNNDGGATYYLPNLAVPDVFAFDPSQYPAPAQAATPDYYVIRSRERDVGFYANVKLEILSNLHVMTGLRYSTYTQDSVSRASYSPDPQVAPPLKDRSHSAPNIAFTYDFFRNYTFYGSHAKIYQPQSLTRSAVGDLIPPPITGVNDELGIKWERSDKKANASIAYYRISKNGFLTTDFQHPGSDIPLINDSRSRGVDVEVTGEILANTQLSASFNHNDNTLTTRTANAPLTAFQPKNKLKSFMTYRVQPDIVVGGGVEYQSSAYNAGHICAQPLTSPTAPCPGFKFVDYQFKTNGYGTVSLMAGYKLTPNIELSVIGKNVTNKKAYAASPYQQLVGYNFYIEPASVLATLRAVW